MNRHRGVLKIDIEIKGYPRLVLLLRARLECDEKKNRDDRTRAPPLNGKAFRRLDPVFSFSDNRQPSLLSARRHVARSSLITIRLQRLRIRAL